MRSEASGTAALRAGPILLIALGVTLAASLALAAPAADALPAAASAATTCGTAKSVATWPLARLAASAVVVPVDVGSVASVDAEVADGVGGVILTGSDDPTDLAHDLAALAARGPTGDAPFVMVDEEGGSVQRLVKVVESLPSARTMAATLSAKQITSLARGLGGQLRALGVTMDLAPVLDLDAGAGPNDVDADGTRSFSLDPATATTDGLAFADGLLAAGVVPVMKHFPGLGEASGNTDLEPASTRPYTGLSTPGLQPFAAGIRADMPAVMVANASVPGLSTAPAGVSGDVINGLLRSKLGFTGLVLTDSLSVPSVSKSGYGLAAAAVAAVEAGADEVLFNALPAATASDTASIEQALEHAVSIGALTRSRLVQSARRALVVKARVDAC